jgi:hypothetical protein
VVFADFRGPLPVRRKGSGQHHLAIAQVADKPLKFRSGGLAFTPA